MPARVGRSPLKNPLTPWASKIRRPMAMGFPPAEASSPVQAEEDWSWVRITSRGFVMQEATVPAMPPERRFNAFNCPAVIDAEAVAATVDAPPLVLPPPLNKSLFKPNLCLDSR